MHHLLPRVWHFISLKRAVVIVLTSTCQISSWKTGLSLVCYMHHFLIAKSLALHQPEKGSSCNCEFNLPDFSLKNWSVTSLLRASFIAKSLALHQPQRAVIVFNSTRQISSWKTDLSLVCYMHHLLLRVWHFISLKRAVVIVFNSTCQISLCKTGQSLVCYMHQLLLRVWHFISLERAVVIVFNSTCQISLWKTGWSLVCYMRHLLLRV